MEKQNLYEVLQNEHEAPSTSEPTPKEPIAKDDDNNQSDHKPVKSFFDRISSLPIVKDGLDKAQQYAVSRFALRQAENTLTHVVQLAPEYAVQKADSLGCRSLDILENRLPVIRESTDTVVKTIKENWVPTPITRLYDRMPRSKADVSRLTQANRLLQEAATNISKLNSSLQGLVIFSRSTVRNQVKGSYEQTQAFANAKMLDVSLDLLNRIDAAAGYLKGVKLPANVQSRIDPVIEFATHEYHIVREEASKPDVPPLRKATNIMHLTSDYVLPIMQDTIDAIQEQLRYYTVYANYSGGKVLNDIKTQWKSLGIRT